MKKLITLLEDNKTVSSMNLSNVVTDIDSTKNDEISETLLNDINSAAKSAGVTVTITTASSGHDKLTSTGTESRHTGGNAVDISMIDSVGWKNKEDAKTKGILNKIEGFVSYLGYEGYTKNSESGQDKSVLYFGFQGHDNHIHVSVKDSGVTTSASTNSSSSSSPSGSSYLDSDSRNKAKEYLTNILGKALGMNENKSNRIINDIEKIKNLLK
jgi:hypothetical protein